MILADKIARFRKKNGWSQEELADKMNVSRQAVSKWEAAQTTPDLEKILLLGNLFGVTTDYLLKDELEDEEFIDDNAGSTLKMVTMEDANAYMEHRKWAAGNIALATFLCIISPICLFLLGAVSEIPDFGVSENVAAFCGLAVLFIIVAIAVSIFICTDAKNRPYSFLDGGAFELDYGVSGMIREKQKKFRNAYVRGNITGACLCILAPVILFVGMFLGNDVASVIALSAMMIAVGIGVGCFISVGVPWASMERLLCEGEFSRAGKAQSRFKEAVGTAYWLVAVAIYLGWSLWTDDWNTTWVVWPVAGVLFAALMAIVNLFVNRDEA